MKNLKIKPIRSRKPFFQSYNFIIFSFISVGFLVFFILVKLLKNVFGIPDFLLSEGIFLIYISLIAFSLSGWLCTRIFGEKFGGKVKPEHKAMWLIWLGGLTSCLVLDVVLTLLDLNKILYVVLSVIGILFIAHVCLGFYWKIKEKSEGK